MMKHTGSVALGLGLVFGVPAMTFGDGLPDSVGSALEETLRAMAVLGQLREDLDVGKSLPPHIIENVTEAPAGEARERDERLAALREDVAQLQSQVDLRNMVHDLEFTTDLPVDVAAGSTPDSATGGEPGPTSASGASDPDVSPTAGASSSGAPELAGTKGTAGITQGLPAGFAESIGSNVQGPLPAPPAGTQGPLTITPQEQPETATTKQPEQTAKVGPEGKGYSAHPLRQAQACFRASRFQRGVEILEAAPASTEADYWRARCLEKLDRLEEAIALYESVELAEDAGDLADAAAGDREFAEWRLGFQEKSGLEPKTTAGAGETKQ